jgi:CheY-like chemotaxis protein
MTRNAPLPSPKKDKRVLVIEDEAPARRFITTALRSLGYHVHAVASAEGAEVVLEETRPDLIVVDIRLPGADGLSFAQRIEQDDQLKHVPVLLISAYDRPRSQLASRFLAKPFELSNFERVVAELVS